MSGTEDKDRSRERNRRVEKPARGPNEKRKRSQDRSAEHGGKKTPQSRRVYVSNIPYEYRWQDCKDLFRNNVGKVSYVELFVDENEKPRGCGIVEFDDVESVAKCLDVMHRYELKGRKLVVTEDMGHERDKYGNVVTGRRDKDRPNFRNEMLGPDRNIPSLLDMSAPANIKMPENYGNTYGLSVQFLKSLGIDPPLVNRVFVANLDYKVDEKKLSEVFRLAGKVINIDLAKDKTGASKGYAVIEYDHPVESVQAISMFDNQMLYDRKMNVRMDRVDVNELPVRLPEGLKGVGMGLGPNGNPLRDVSNNLPSNSANNNSGSGILGDVPNQPLQNISAAALSNVVGSGQGLSNLGSQVALQASLAGVGGLSNLANFNSGGLGTSLVSNPLTQNAALAATLAASNSNLNSASSMGNQGNYRQHDSNFSGNFMPMNNQSGRLSFDMKDRLGRDSRDYDSHSNIRNRDYMNDDDQNYRSPMAYSTPASNGMRDSMLQSRNMPSQNSFSVTDTIIVSNLPPTISWQTLRDKFRSFGEIKYAEMRGKDIGIIRFSDEMRAKDAVDMMDRTRIDGRTIDVRFF